uniref:G-protein coupled receptors family 1 profile domain-containing protein n=1 Tax=Erpetoichthys calabaricus TaxID=27687 RepID=A0A8C4RGH6_ERPCA
MSSANFTQGILWDQSKSGCSTRNKCKIEIMKHDSLCYPNNNASCLKGFLETKYYFGLYILSALITVLTVSGNLFVIISICHFRQLQTPTNINVLSLAVIDFLIGLTVMPFQFSCSIEYCWYFGDTMCTSSVSNLVCISVDRYLAVCNPFFYNARVTESRTLFYVLLSWLLSLWYILAYMHSEGNYIRRDCVGDCVFVYTATWGLADLLCTFFLPFSVMTCLYTRIIMVARRHARAINSVIQKDDKTKQSKNSKISKSDRKAAKTLGIVVATFMLCWLPSLLMSVFYEYLTLTSNIIYDIYCVFGLLSLINSGLNPIIYALFYPWNIFVVFDNKFRITPNFLPVGNSSVKCLPEQTNQTLLMKNLLLNIVKTAKSEPLILK